MMLDHQQRLVAERSPVERLQGGRQRRAVLVRGVEEKKVVGAEVAVVRPQPVDGVCVCHVALLGEPGCGQILRDDGSTGSVEFHECRGCRTTRQRFDTQCPGASEEIEDSRTAYAVADDVEQGLSHQRRSRSRCSARRRLEQASTAGPSGDARGRTRHAMSKTGGSV
jgi:hypothetical protein